MSLDDYSLVLSPQAEEDFTDILQYTLQTWGDRQMNAYRAVIDKALHTLLQNPLIGQVRSDISLHHRSFPAGQHVVYYRVSQRSILVARILHQRMDTMRNKI